jgi:hypothetical protein
MDKETQSELDQLRAANEALTERAQQAEQQLALKIFHDIGQAVPEHAYLVQQAYVMEKRAAAAEVRCDRLEAALGMAREALVKYGALTEPGYLVHDYIDAALNGKDSTFLSKRDHE